MAHIGEKFALMPAIGLRQLFGVFEQAEAISLAFLAGGDVANIDDRAIEPFEIKGNGRALHVENRSIQPEALLLDDGHGPLFFQYDSHALGADYAIGGMVPVEDGLTHKLLRRVGAKEAKGGGVEIAKAMPGINVDT